MNRVTKRTWLMALFILVLLGGMLVFTWEYVTEAKDWVAFSGSPHVYNSSNLGCGTVTDRSGRCFWILRTPGPIQAMWLPANPPSTGWGTGRLYYAGDGSPAMRGDGGLDGSHGVTILQAPRTAALTLSAHVQNTALEAMAGRKGTIAVYNYKTGEILCALSTPTYDPDNVPDMEGNDAYEGVFINRFLQSAYVPGSIFKIVTTATALDCVPGIEEKTFTCYGKLEYGTEAVTCEKAHGTQTLKQAFANSCNCAFAQIAELIGKKNMVSHVEKFGITERLSFDGVTTAEGNYDVSNTAPVSFAWSCIGQHTDLINPARYMTFMGAIAGGGVGAEPYLVSRIQCGDQVTYEAKTQKTDRILSREVAAIVQSYMRNNVQSVYGDWNFPGLSVCAKSGTSQLGGGQTSNAMFAGFVENEEYPLAFIVVVENGGYGSHTCVPILSKVLAACKTVMDAE